MTRPCCHCSAKFYPASVMLCHGVRYQHTINKLHLYCLYPKEVNKKTQAVLFVPLREMIYLYSTAQVHPRHPST
jgi:hypothetical protein